MRQIKASRIVSLMLLASLVFSPIALPHVPAIAATPYAEPSAALDIPSDVTDETIIRIDGSKSMSVINQTLKQQFEDEFPDKSIDLDTRGTETAIQELINGDIDLAAIGRSLTEEERSQGLAEIPLSLDKIAVIIGKENPFTGNLTLEEFAALMRGDITDWSQLGREPGQIRFIDRPVDSDTRLALERYGIFRDGPTPPDASIVELKTDNTAAVVKQLGKNGIGYAIATQVNSLDNVKFVRMAILMDTLPGDALYPYAQTRGYAYRADSEEAIAPFLGFASTEAGQAALKSAKIAEAKAVMAPFMARPAVKPADDRVAVAIDQPVEPRRLSPLLWLLLPLGLLGLIPIFRKRSKPSEVAVSTTAQVATGMAAPAETIVLPTVEEVELTEEFVAPEVIADITAVEASSIDPLESTYQEGRRLLSEGKYAEALPWLDEAIALNPNDAAVLTDKGTALLRMERFEESLPFFAQAIAIQQNLPKAWFNRSSALVQLGRTDEAIANLQQATALFPSDRAIARLLSTLTEVEPVPANLPIVPSVNADLPVTTAETTDSTSLDLLSPGVDIDAVPAESALAETIAVPPQEAIGAAFSPAEAEAAAIAPASFEQEICRSLALRELSPKSATDQDYYQAVSKVVCQRLLRHNTPITYLSDPEVKLVAELSAEYLPGPHLLNNLMNAGLTEDVQTFLQSQGRDLQAIAALEEEPGLGRGGLGRLMMCYLDSLATAEIPAIGYGLRYEYGIFDQVIEDGWQVEVPDTWLQFGNPWEVEYADRAVEVQFGGHTEAVVDDAGALRVRWIPYETVRSSLYVTPVAGYLSKTVNLLQLWRAEGSTSLCHVLYPVDSDPQGRELRLRQQFFLISCSLQDAIRLHLQAGHPIANLPDRFAIQLNDTDTALAVAELLRLLIDEQKLDWETAWSITQRTLSYTNHSLMPETLDDLWSIPSLERILPRHLELIYEINDRLLKQVRDRYPHDESRVQRMSLIQEGDGRHLRLTNLACVGTHAVNGVSSLHSNLLQQMLISNFVEMFGDRFSNKTNGVSQRRFLLLSNPRLANLITRYIGDGWIKNLEVLNRLESFADNAEFRNEWRQVKQAAKQDLVNEVYRYQSIAIDVNSLFDVHATVIHEYKRQHLNALHILTLYNRLKANPQLDIVPRTFIFSGKAAPDYGTAKLMIKLVHAIATLVNHDADVRDRMKVVFLPDFTIKQIQWLYPATDLSNHLSTAGTEACDTANMICAMNGALIIGSPDGSNLELRDAISPSNLFQFGLSAEEAIALRNGGYSPIDHYNSNGELKDAIDLLTSGILSNGDAELFRPLVNLLLYSDRYLLLADYQSFVDCKEYVSQGYRNSEGWARSSILTAARIGRFSSDRAIREYSQDIWQVRPVPESLRDRRELLMS